MEGAHLCADTCAVGQRCLEEQKVEVTWSRHQGHSEENVLQPLRERAFLALCFLKGVGLPDMLVKGSKAKNASCAVSPSL